MPQQPEDFSSRIVREGFCVARRSPPPVEQETGHYDQKVPRPEAVPRQPVEQEERSEELQENGGVKQHGDTDAPDAADGELFDRGAICVSLGAGPL